MRFFVELSGEHPTLPRAEALAALEAEGVELGSVSWRNRVLHVEGAGPVARALSRIGLAHVVCEELVTGDFDAVRAWARAADLAGRRFRVRTRPSGIDADVPALEGALGADLGRTGRVDLRSPEVDLRLLAADRFVLGKVLHRVDRASFEARRVARRSFSLPISLHPKFARALVNLSRVPAGGTLLDPFCGTGGVLLEAAQVGIRPVGSDLRRAMALGTRGSLARLDSPADLVVADAGRGPWRPRRFDGIATDPPYGRAASTRGEPLSSLYERAYASFAEILPRGRWLSMVLPSDRAVEIGERHMTLVESHSLRVHRSLTRIFCAFLNGG